MAKSSMRRVPARLFAYRDTKRTTIMARLPLGRVGEQIASLWTVHLRTGTPSQMAAIAFSSPAAPSTMRNCGPSQPA